tara:strand:- start:8219 stop:9961 length:1743 start_codon:yes stop_codon:yes gene_type:complete
MDYSKVNNALSGWVGSGQRRDRAKAELGEAMQLMQAQQQLQANQNAKEQELNEWQQYIHGMASQIAIRNEDKDRIQAMYDQEKDVFLSELEKYGNDPVKFMNSGGRKTMQNFFNNIALSDDAKRISANTKEVQGFYEQLEGDNGKNAYLIPNQVRREFNAYMNGDIDSFKHRSLASWDDPTDDSRGNTLAEKYMNTGTNYLKFKNNYAIEYGLGEEEYLNISDDQLERYVAEYVGGGNPMQALQPLQQGTEVNKSVAGRMQRQHKRLGMKQIDTSVISGKSQEYVTALRDYDMGNFNIGVTPNNTDIMGHQGFVGNELAMSQAVLGKNTIVDLEKYAEDVKAINGVWYDEDGSMVTPGDEMGDIRPGAIFMGYKIKQADGSYKLVKKEDLDGEPTNAEHALIQEYESDDVLWFNSYYYNEIDPNDTKTMSAYSDILGQDTALQRYTTDKLSDAPEPVVKKPITVDSSVNDIQSQIGVYTDPVERVMDVIGLGTKKNDTTKSILLSLAAVEGDMDEGINSLTQRFNPNSFPELNQALLSGSTKDFFDAYYDLLTANGVDAQAAEDYIMQVDKLRDKIQRAL